MYTWFYKGFDVFLFDWLIFCYAFMSMNFKTHIVAFSFGKNMYSMGGLRRFWFSRSTGTSISGMWACM